MKCKRCRKSAAAVDLPSHHSAFCPECFFVFFRRQVEEGIRKFSLLSPHDRVLVCVSGGKDSLVLWDILLFQDEMVPILLPPAPFLNRKRDGSLL